MSERKRHPLIEFQRAVRLRRPVFAKDSDGDEVRHPQGTQSREEFRREQNQDRRLKKHEATRTARQRSNEESLFQRFRWWQKLPLAEKERRIRRLPKTAKVEIVTKGSSIIVPGKRQDVVPEKKVGGLRKLASGIVIPGRSRS